MSVGIHSFVQHANDFYGVRIRATEENDMAALRKFSVARSKAVSRDRYLRSVSETPERVKQLADIGVSLGFPPSPQGVFGNFPQVSIGCRRQLESSHSC